MVNANMISFNHSYFRHNLLLYTKMAIIRFDEKFVNKYRKMQTNCIRFDVDRQPVALFAYLDGF